jgi:TRAP-type mannitol/chloroaromatic compound transport system permease large subunit
MPYRSPIQNSSEFSGHAASGLLTLFLFISLVWSVRSAQPAAVPKLDESSKSVFVDDPKFGKDPFFPKSTRRVVQIVAPPIAVSPGNFSQIFNGIALKGISGVAGKRLALLNNRTFQAGEEFDFRFNNQIFKVRCIEVREKSVVIGIEGTPETKEIQLRQGI